MTGQSQSGKGSPYSCLAWELATHAVVARDGDRVKATVTLSDGDQVTGWGETVGVALRRLASALMVLA